MKYLNFILTLIAFLMFILILQNCSNPVGVAKASDGIQDVNIKQIGGDTIYSKVLIVEVK